LGEALARDLENCHPKACTILQYVDDILSGPHPGGLQKQNRRTTPIPTGSRIQSLTKESTDLSRGGHILGVSPEPREKKPGNWEKRSILRYLHPESWRQLREFLVAVGFCCLWIPGFLVTARPLYVALKGNPIGPLHWVPDQEDPFQKLK
jgi:hypothetical protein